MNTLQAHHPYSGIPMTTGTDHTTFTVASLLMTGLGRLGIYIYSKRHDNKLHPIFSPVVNLGPCSKKNQACPSNHNLEHRVSHLLPPRHLQRCRFPHEPSKTEHQRSEIPNCPWSASLCFLGYASEAPFAFCSSMVQLVVAQKMIGILPV